MPINIISTVSCQRLSHTPSRCETSTNQPFAPGLSQPGRLQRRAVRPACPFSGIQWLALAVITLAVADAGGQPASPFKTPEEKSSYVIGVDLARNLKRQGMEVQLDLVIRGLQDGLTGEKLIIPEREFRQVLVNVQTVARRRQAQYRGHTAGEINLKRGEFFLEENKAKPGVTALPSGLQYQVIKAGTGPKPTDADTVECYYLSLIHI